MARHGWVRYGSVGCGRVWQARPGALGHGGVRQGTARQARQGRVRQGTAGLGMAWQARLGAVRYGMARQVAVGRGVSGQVPAGMEGRRYEARLVQDH